jgi:L-ascorbate metabolism protein UlaG (beta-lactamase superfamily)
MRVVHLGDLGQPKLTAEQLAALGKVDVLLVPVGGFFTVDPAQAAEVVKQLDPKRVVVPMHFKVPGLEIEQLGPVDPFVALFPKARKEASNTLLVPVVAKDLPGFDVVVLERK